MKSRAKGNKVSKADFVINHLYDTPVIIHSSRGAGKSQGIRAFLRYYIEGCSREDLLAISMFVTELMKVNETIK